MFTSTRQRSMMEAMAPHPSVITTFSKPVVSGYADLRPPADARRFGQARALAVLASLAVNVITI